MNEKKRTVGGLQSLLATVRSLDPATTAELGALHNLRLHVAAPLHQMIEEALTWLENIDLLVTEQMPTLGVATPASSLPQSWRLLWQMSFSAQCELTEAARDLDLTGCGWEEGLSRCETASRQVKDALRQVVGAVQDIDHLERIEANATLAQLATAGVSRERQPLVLSERQRLARGSAHVVTNSTTSPALRATERYPEKVIEQLFAESERESLACRTISPPQPVWFRTPREEPSGLIEENRLRAPLTLDAE
jgi:hypothetical protein